IGGDGVLYVVSGGQQLYEIRGGPATGSISVATNLAAATFTISGPVSLSGSGTSASFAIAPVGKYTITFGPITGYVSPESQTQTLESGVALHFSATYTPILLSVSPPSLPFAYSVGQSGPSSQPLSFSANAGMLTFAVSPSTSAGGNWLSVSSTGGFT